MQQHDLCQDLDKLVQLMSNYKQKKVKQIVSPPEAMEHHTQHQNPVLPDQNVIFQGKSVSCGENKTAVEPCRLYAPTHWTLVEWFYDDPAVELPVSSELKYQYQRLCSQP